MGMDIASEPVSDVLGSARRGFAVVANSGDNSVSIFGPLGTLNAATGTFTLTPLSLVTGVPSPYAVSTCPINSNGVASVLVTSPSDNSVRVVVPSIQGGTFSGVGAPTVQTGSQPYSVASSGGLRGANGTGIVSNVGDNTLTVFDVASLKVIATIPGVPGARGFHGIAVSIVGDAADQNIILAWVAGTDANVMTVVDLVHSTVLTQIPILSPTAVLPNGPLNAIYVASASLGSITAYDVSTISQVNNQFASVPNPQDFVLSPLFGDFAISGPGSLWSFDPSNSANTGPVGNVPGAAALAAPYFFSNGGVAACCAFVLVISTSTNSVYLIQPAPSTPSQFTIQSVASFGATGAAAGSLVSAVPVATGVGQNFSATSIPLPTVLGGVTMSIGGSLNFDTPSNMWVYSPTGSIQAPLLFVGPNQINFQIPPGIGVGSSVPAQLTKPDGSTFLTTLNVTATSPGIFTLSMNGQGQGTVLNQDNSQNGIPQIITGANPAPRGSVIQIFATGAGATNPPLGAGDAAPSSGNPLVLTVVQPTVNIGGVNAPVQFSGMDPGYPGVWQINAEVPLSVTPGNAVPLIVKAGSASSNTVTIAVN
jgi:uncharacterized protein (TIGR03437 family)